MDMILIVKHVEYEACEAIIRLLKLEVAKNDLTFGHMGYSQAIYVQIYMYSTPLSRRKFEVVRVLDHDFRGHQSWEDWDLGNFGSHLLRISTKRRHPRLVEILKGPFIQMCINIAPQRGEKTFCLILICLQEESEAQDHRVDPLKHKLYVKKF